MANFSFGAGSLWGVSTADGVQTPIKFGTVQEVAIETSFNKKELYGSHQFPVAIARGTGKVSCKAKFAQIDGDAYNSLFFGANMVTGQLLVANDESKSIPAATPFTITTTNSVNFSEDLGVTLADGTQLTKVASSPSVGQYSVSAGVYTFNTGDASKAVLISYTYTNSTSGKKIEVSNQLLGTSPFFSAYFTTVYNGKNVTYKLNRCMSSKLGFATKLEDFSIPEFDFDAFADDSGKVMTISTAE